MTGLYSRAILVMAVWMLAASVQAVGAGIGTVSLRAVTATGAPLMRPVSWKIYVVRNNTRSLMVGFKRHSGVLSLRQGSYIAELLFSGIQYQEPFILKAGTDVDVTISVKQEIRVF